jgi:cytochrome bd-type quinol oxidase subunit 2
MSKSEALKRFLVVVLACAIGLAVAFAFAYVAGLARPCQGERLTCSMVDVIGIVYTPVFAAVALIGFSLAVLWKQSRRALNIAVLLPLAAFLSLIGALKYSQFSVREFHDIRESDVQELLRVFIPIILTLVVPWAVLRRLELKRTQNG